MRAAPRNVKYALHRHRGLPPESFEPVSYAAVNRYRDPTDDGR